MSSFLYRTDGTIIPVAPANGVHWTLEEMQGMVGGYVEIKRTIDSRWIVLNENGKVVKPMLPLNIAATRLYLYGRHDPIVGPALIVDNRLELDGPEEKEDA